MYYVLLGILIIIEILNLIVNLLKLNINQPKVDTTEYKMTDKEINSFKEADVDAVKSFMESISELNEFMTGNTEEDNKVEQQDF